MNGISALTEKIKGPQRASLRLPPCKDKSMALCDKELCSMLCDSLDGQGVWWKMDTRVCMAEFLCCPPVIITMLLISYTPI